jgi:protein subunit release factor B
VISPILGRGRMNPMTRVTVEPLRGMDADGFAATLRRMYSAWRGPVDGEEGLHRLVQQSPLDPEQKRQTSFVRVLVDGETSEEVVRTYVTFPYRMVKDHRTGRTTENVAGVTGGDLSLVRGDG